MKLLIPQKLLRHLRRELKGARRLEIGGLLLGEHIEGEMFRLVEATVQKTGGSPVHFVRDPALHQVQLDEFFARTGNDYERYNYIGEWHSHPSFEPLPSTEDMKTVQSIVQDPRVGVNFLVLVIVRLSRWRTIRLSACMVQPGVAPRPVDLEVEDFGAEPVGIIACLWRRLFIPAA